jgi:hypothetical protein
MALPPRGMARLNRLAPPGGGAGGTGGSSNPADDRASSFLDKMHQKRANKIASGHADAALTKGQERRMELARFRGAGVAAKSTAHQGVVARPMDQNLSKILQRAREDLRTRGTSVARVKRHEQFEDEEEEGAVDKEPELVRPEDVSARTLRAANASQDLTEKGTSIGRMRTAKKEMGLKNPIVKPPDEPSEMMI